MATIDDVVVLAAGLPGVSEGEHHGNRMWFVADRGFTWERRFSKADLKRFGATAPPDGPIIAVAVADLSEKEAVLAEHRQGVFTIPQIDGYPAVLIDLASVSTVVLRGLIVDAWLVYAPCDVANDYLGPS